MTLAGTPDGRSHVSSSDTRTDGGVRRWATLQPTELEGHDKMGRRDEWWRPRQWAEVMQPTEQEVCDERRRRGRRQRSRRQRTTPYVGSTMSGGGASALPHKNVDKQLEF